MTDATQPTTATRETVMPDCPVCRSQAATEYVAHPEVLWVKCGCGLIYKRAETAALAASNTYQEEYFTGGVYTKRRWRRIQKSRHQLLDALNFAERGASLDIGCSMGYVLDAARGLGLEPAGTDVSEFAAAACRERGYEARQGTMTALPFADARFSVVTMKHVLEHTPDPRAALREVRRVLRPGGALFIAVPDPRYGRAVRNPRASRFYGPRRSRQHFIYYSPATLAQLLSEEGLRAVRVNPCIVHRRAPPAVRALQYATWPLRAAGQWLADALRLRKEFWLTAVRVD
ncbi:MAG: methyltransferase domain-containing protein [Steroidobacteraceae bacterium]